MKPESEWDALRARLERMQAAVAAEIRSYPPPIPACDAQYNHLLERRAALSAARARLGARTGETVSWHVWERPQ